MADIAAQLADSETEEVTSPDDGDSDKTPKDAKEWLAEIEQAEKDSRTYYERCKKLQKLYSRQGKTEDNKRKFAMLWSNVETLKPAVYAKSPNPEVNRRFTDKDQTARAVSDILQRSLTTIYDLSDIDSCIRAVRDDFLLVARGSAWVRYVPTFKDKTYGQETISTLYDETLAYDFVHWSDLVHPKSRCWKDLPWLARRVYLDDQRFEDRFKDNFVKRYGEEWWTKIKVGLKDSKKDRDYLNGDSKSDKATICTYEVWSKRDKKVVWLAKSCEYILDEQPPLYDLRYFWPCPKPAYGTLSTDSLIPTPDYVYYQDQAEEIDALTKRIDALTDSLKLVGFYPQGAEGEVSSALEQALKPGTDNQMIPVPGWASFVTGGGSKGLIEWMPVDMVIKVLQGCIDLRRQLIEDVYQITGISDILRGATDPDETARAQTIKAQWGSIRIRDRQAELARFARDMTRISAEIISEKFQPDTLWKLSGLQFPTAAEKQQLEARLAAEAQTIPPPGPQQQDGGGAEDQPGAPVQPEALPPPPMNGGMPQAMPPKPFEMATVPNVP